MIAPCSTHQPQAVLYGHGDLPSWIHALRSLRIESAPVEPAVSRSMANGYDSIDRAFSAEKSIPLKGKSTEVTLWGLGVYAIKIL